MKDLIPMIIAAIVVMIVVVAISSRFKISNRYERKPRELNTWSALDKGIDPTVSNESESDVSRNEKR